MALARDKKKSQYFKNKDLSFYKINQLELKISENETLKKWEFLCKHCEKSCA